MLSRVQEDFTGVAPAPFNLQHAVAAAGAAAGAVVTTGAAIAGGAVIQAGQEVVKRTAGLFARSDDDDGDDAPTYPQRSSSSASASAASAAGAQLRAEGAPPLRRPVDVDTTDTSPEQWAKSFFVYVDALVAERAAGPRPRDADGAPPGPWASLGPALQRRRTLWERLTSTLSPSGAARGKGRRFERSLTSA